MSNRALLKQFRDWQQAGAPLVLATVIRTEGSTYSKAGRQIIINASGDYAGLVSGGCLEGDLIEQTKTVLASGEATIVCYDMRDEADDLWGMGLGCNGMLEILLQVLSADNEWQPFNEIAARMAQPVVTDCAIVVAGDSQLPLGTLLGDGPKPDGVQAISWQIQPWPRLLLLGAGPDAAPVVNIGHELGWEITVADHRPQYFAANRFAMADMTQVVDPASLNEQLPLRDYDAVVVMSHHIESDQLYLQQLAACRHRYIGLLGPAARKQKLLNNLGLSDSKFAAALHGPVGLNIGSDSPATIALAIVSEIQAALHATPQRKLHTSRDA
jgi:xanthine dehydrogenase accessory factor